MIDPDVFNTVVGEAGCDFPVLHEDFDATGKIAERNLHLNVILWELLVASQGHLTFKNQLSIIPRWAMTVMRSAMVVGFLIGQRYENAIASSPEGFMATK